MIAENFILTGPKNIKLYVFSKFQGFSKATVPLQMRAIDASLAIVQKGNTVKRDSKPFSLTLLLVYDSLGDPKRRWY